MIKQTTLVLLVLSATLCMAQNQVTGTIVDELGLPVNKAMIIMEHDNKPIFTDFEGTFSIKSETDFYWKIKISCEGYLTETYYVLDGGKTGDIVLSYDIDLDTILNDDHGFNLKMDDGPNELQLAVNSFLGKHQFLSLTNNPTLLTYRFLD